METIGLGMPGGPEIIVILFIFLLLFGAKKLPELSRALGKSLGEFRKGKDDLEQEIRDVQTDLHKTATTPDIEEKIDPKTEPIEDVESDGEIDPSKAANEPAARDHS